MKVCYVSTSSWLAWLKYHVNKTRLWKIFQQLRIMETATLFNLKFSDLYSGYISLVEI